MDTFLESVRQHPAIIFLIAQAIALIISSVVIFILWRKKNDRNK